MIRAEIRFKNAAFMNALERSEYNSIAEFSRVSGISYSYLVEYANLRHSFKKLADQVKIAQLLECELYELFDQYDEVVEKNKGVVKKVVKEIPINKLLSFDSKQVKMLESDYTTDDIDHKIGIEKEVGDSLNMLRHREKDVIKMHFGIGVDRPMSLVEIGEEVGLSRERVRQIKEKAIRRLRHRSRSKELLSYAILSPSAKKEQREKMQYSYGYNKKHSRELEAEYKREKQK